MRKHANCLIECFNGFFFSSSNSSKTGRNRIKRLQRLKWRRETNKLQESNWKFWPNISRGNENKTNRRKKLKKLTFRFQQRSETCTKCRDFWLETKGKAKEKCPNLKRKEKTNMHRSTCKKKVSGKCPKWKRKAEGLHA